MRGRVHLLVVTVCLLLSPSARAASVDEPHPPVQALRIDEPVRVDGVLDETVWRTRPHNNGLVQNDPANGVPPVHLTDWWIGYDDEALYAAFRLHDTAPDSIETEVARRDVYLNTDRIELELDTFNDGRNGYLFRVTAGGAIADATLYNDGWGDHSWDGVWQSAAQVTPTGWNCEIRIPLSQLRFPDDANQTWGINVSRYNKRNQERDDLFHRPRNSSGYISRFPDLVGLENLRSGSSREVLLYGAARASYLQAAQGDPFDDGSEYDGNVGADLRWGLSNSLTLNATFNPDFGQVEVDPAVVNLSDFETFFPEKRPFFVQDSSIFRFGLDGTNNSWGFNWMEPIPFYSRRIGRRPQLDPDKEHDFSHTPQATTILGAGKVTGTFGSAKVGMLTAVTAEERHSLARDGSFFDDLAEPMTNYSVVRGTNTFDDGRRALGFMMTGTVRDLATPAARSELVRGAYTLGVDGWSYLDTEQRWALKAYASGSLIEGSTDAIDKVQRSSQRYYQRPDADHLDYDSERTSLAGWAARAMINKQKGDWTLNSALGAVSPGYEINDLGFQNRADHINTHLAFGRRWSEPSGPFRQRNFTLAGYSTWDFGGVRSGGGVGGFWWMQFKNYWSFEGNVFYNPSAQSTRATRGGPLMATPVNREFWMGLWGDHRMAVRPGFWLGAGEDTAGGSNVHGGFELTVKPSSALTFSIEPGFQHWIEDAQYVGTVDDPAASTYGSRYLFGHLDYRELELGLRLDWAFTPQLTVQAFAQPLLAVGSYSGLREFTDPAGYDFRVYGEDGASTLDYDAVEAQYVVDPGDGGDVFRVDDPDFNFKSLRLNMVLRWEYSPGSTFYLVWTRDKTDTRDPGRMDLDRDVKSLLRAEGDDIVMVKLTRWLDF